MKSLKILISSIVIFSLTSLANTKEIKIERKLASAASEQLLVDWLSDSN